MCFVISHQFRVITLSSCPLHIPYLPTQHVLQVCHDIGNNSPQRRAEIHIMRVLNGHGVTFTVVEPKVAAVFHVEAGTWIRGRDKDR